MDGVPPFLTASSASANLGLRNPASPSSVSFAKSSPTPAGGAGSELAFPVLGGRDGGVGRDFSSSSTRRASFRFSSSSRTLWYGDAAGGAGRASSGRLAGPRRSQATPIAATPATKPARSPVRKVEVMADHLSPFGATAPTARSGLPPESPDYGKRGSGSASQSLLRRRDRRGRDENTENRELDGNSAGTQESDQELAFGQGKRRQLQHRSNQDEDGPVPEEAPGQSMGSRLFADLQRERPAE